MLLDKYLTEIRRERKEEAVVNEVNARFLRAQDDLIQSFPGLTSKQRDIALANITSALISRL